jgi:hypothetical protein
MAVTHAADGGAVAVQRKAGPMQFLTHVPALRDGPRFAAAVVCGGLLCVAPAAAQPVHLAPHRAVYDIALDRSAPGSGVVEMSGRMVYELTGSACEGYTQNMRFVTRSAGPDGASRLSDLRTSSWEETGGKRLRFTSTQYQDDVLSDAAQGDAGRDGDGIRIALDKPAPKEVKVGGRVYFPIEHSIALIEAARAGRPLFTADLFDGSEKGEKVYATSAVIGKRTPPGVARMPAGVKNGDTLEALPSWPIAISYFEPGSDKKDTVPTYELGYRFYDNGVSTGLRIDYGEFAIRGEIKELVFLEPSKCPQ